MKERLLGLLGRGRAQTEEEDGIFGALREQGVSGELLLRASAHRHLLRTRTISTLVEEAEISARAGLEVLCGHLGLPGLLLRRSVIDLTLGLLPDELTFERLILPVQRDPDDFILLAVADPISEQLVQEIELILGGPVRPHLALHYYLRRSARACHELCRERQDARLLLGDDVEAEEVIESQQLVTTVIPDAPLPSLWQADSTHRTEQTCVLVATTDSQCMAQTENALVELDCRVMKATNGQAALRLIRTQSPDLIILSAQLPGRSGCEVLDLLASGERFHAQSKILIVPEQLQGMRSRFAEIENLELVSPAQLPASAAGCVAAIAAQGQHRVEQERIRRQARASYHEGMVLLEKNMQNEALEHLQAALSADPLLAEAHRELGRLRLSRGERALAEISFGWACSLEDSDPEDLASLAELVQRRGDLRRAAVLWHAAAAKATETEVKAALGSHAEGLLKRSAGGP